MKTITITDIAAAYAEECNITKKEAAERIKAVYDRTGDAILDASEDEGKVFISGFGTFTPVVKPAHTMTSNLDGQEHEIPEKVIVKFKASAALGVNVNGY